MLGKRFGEEEEQPRSIAEQEEATPEEGDSSRSDTDLGKDQVLARENQNPETLFDEFPSASGDKETEVSKRNIDGESGSTFVKQYIVLKREWNDDDYAHQANVKNTREVMLHAGLRPTGDVEFVGSEDHPDGVSLILTYSGPVQPALTDEETNFVEGFVLKQQRESDVPATPSAEGR